ncbi:hypothetical protein HZ326_29269 [Fusarium oxysporum f. sp. albedinis]|nr:hypothetical protein HZ326_29269 [Fusarium oxysporum f. sp. albedinis]
MAERTSAGDNEGQPFYPSPVCYPSSSLTCHSTALHWPTPASLHITSLHFTFSFIHLVSSACVCVCVCVSVSSVTHPVAPLFASLKRDRHPRHPSIAAARLHFALPKKLAHTPVCSQLLFCPPRLFDVGPKTILQLAIAV